MGLEQLLVLFHRVSSNDPDTCSVGAQHWETSLLRSRKRIAGQNFHFNPTNAVSMVRCIDIREPLLKGVPMCFHDEPLKTAQSFNECVLQDCFRSRPVSCCQWIHRVEPVKSCEELPVEE
jgi:hypothetical protein